MAKICRTCAQTITSECVFVNGSSCVSNLQIKDLLETCVPELDLDIPMDSALCINCTTFLHISYYFKENVLKSEELFYSKHRLRVKNMDILTKVIQDDSSLSNGDIDIFSKLDDSDKFEMELDDANDLKLEFVYDGESASNVEFVANLTEPLIDIVDQEQNDLSIDDKILDYSVNLPFDVSLTDEVSNIENVLPDQINNTNEQTEKVNEMDKLTSYIQHTTNSSRKARDIKRPYKCNDCNFKSDARAGLRMHQRIHTGETPFPCSLCNYKAKRKAHLEDHMKVHTGERPFKCLMCNKSFITKQVLKKHERIHTGDKPYECMQCNYKSRHRPCIKNHVRKMHVDLNKLNLVQRYICSVCGKCLSGSSSLNTHMKIHTGIKTHLCELCGRYFREKGMLLNHLRTHTKEKPFKCTKCDYIATRKAHLQDHMKTHDSNTELVSCTECEKQYASKLLLRKHKREEHIKQASNHG